MGTVRFAAAFLIFFSVGGSASANDDARAGDSGGCGASCVYLLLETLGRPAEYEHIVRRFPVLREECSLYDLQRALEAFECASTAVRFDDRSFLQRLPGPAVLQLVAPKTEARHFVVAYPTNGAISIADPLWTTPLRLDDVKGSMLDHSFSGNALLVGITTPTGLLGAPIQFYASLTAAILSGTLLASLVRAGSSRPPPWLANGGAKAGDRS